MAGPCYSDVLDPCHDRRVAAHAPLVARTVRRLGLVSRGHLPVFVVVTVVHTFTMVLLSAALATQQIGAWGSFLIQLRGRLNAQLLTTRRLPGPVPRSRSTAVPGSAAAASRLEAELPPHACRPSAGTCSRIPLQQSPQHRGARPYRRHRRGRAADGGPQRPAALRARRGRPPVCAAERGAADRRALSRNPARAVPRSARGHGRISRRTSRMRGCRCSSCSRSSRTPSAMASRRGCARDGSWCGRFVTTGARASTSRTVAWACRPDGRSGLDRDRPPQPGVAPERRVRGCRCARGRSAGGGWRQSNRDAALRPVMS